GAEGLDEVGEAEDLDGGETAAVAGGELACGEFESTVVLEAQAILIEMAAEAVAGKDDRVLLQPPGGRFLLPGEELQAGRLDGRAADLLRPRAGGGWGRGRRGFAAIAGGESEEKEEEDPRSHSD